MKYLSACCAFLLMITACSKSGLKGISNGSYEGYFAKSCGLNENCIPVNMQPKTIELTFAPNTFHAQRLHTFQQGACSGNYLLSGDSIYFSNNCSLNGNTDSIYFFQGGYQITLNTGDSLIFRKSLDLSSPEYPIEAYYFKKVQQN